MACRVKMRQWARARTAWPKAVCLGRVCTDRKPEQRGRSVVRPKADRNRANLSLIVVTVRDVLTADR